MVTLHALSATTIDNTPAIRTSFIHILRCDNPELFGHNNINAHGSGFGLQESSTERSKESGTALAELDKRRGVVTRMDVSGTVNNVGAHFEMQVESWTATSYYFFGAQRVAMRVTPAVGAGTVRVAWLHGDHLGSASLTTNITGTKVAELRYLPFGEVRWQSGSTPTDRTFTGQRSESQSLVGSLMDYGARFYSPLLGRFISADSIVPQPGNPQSLNRFAYTLNNPLRYTDPTGHDAACPGESAGECAKEGGGKTPEWVGQYCAGRDLLCEYDQLGNFALAHPEYDPLGSSSLSGRLQEQLIKIYAQIALDRGNRSEAERLLNPYFQSEGVNEFVAAAPAAGILIGQSVPVIAGGLKAAAKIFTGSSSSAASGTGLTTGHGNSYASKKLTHLYDLIDAKTGAHLKWGITSETVPENRYTRAFMVDKYMVVVDQGTRVDMAARERTLTSSFPGSLNKEPWAGTVSWVDP